MSVNPTPKFGTSTPVALRTDYVTEASTATPEPPNGADPARPAGAMDAADAEVNAIALWAGNGQQSFAAMALAAVQSALNAKQNTLVSGTNLKTVGGASLLGSGDVPLNAAAISDFSAAADARIALQKGANNGIAPLDGGGKVPASALPAYVDDVLEYANAAAFPATGSTGVIYVADDTDKEYRWTGTAYREISPSPGNLDAVPDSATRLAMTPGERAKLSNTSGTNTGDETASGIRTKLGITTLSGSNTGDQTIPPEQYGASFTSNGQSTLR